MSKSEPTVPVRYFEAPPDVLGLLPSGNPYTCGMFVIEYLVPLMPRQTQEQRDLVRAVVAVATDLEAGDKHALIAPEWQAVSDALDALQVVSVRGMPNTLSTPVYVRVLGFYDALYGAKTKKPAGWDPPAATESTEARQ